MVWLIERLAIEEIRMHWSNPVLLVKMGRYPAHYGGLWIARSLGRAGVPVYALTESRLTPLAASRYVTRAGSQLEPRASDAENKRVLDAAIRRVGEPVVAIATDDEAAVWLAEQRPAGCILPDVEPSLPRALADKWSLHTLCEQYGVLSPLTCMPDSREQLDALMHQMRFPLILKNREAFTRLTDPSVPYTTVVDTPEDLTGWADGHFSREHPPLVQECTPADVAQKWSYQAYRSARVCTSFVGLKRRDYPLHRGEATLVESLPNPTVADLGDRFLKEVNYAGLADLDFVLDTRDGLYRLIDFNPRVGAIAAMCATRDGLDLLRIGYLDLTGQPVEPGPQVFHRVFQVEPRDALARAELGVEDAPPPTVTAFRADDDRRPGLVRRARRTVSRLRSLIGS